MLANLSYSKKCLLILAFFILFLVLGYRLSFRQTFEIKKDIKEKEKKIMWLREKEKDIPFLKSKMAMAEKLAVYDSTSLRDKLTAFISDLAVNTDCTVTEIPYSTSVVNRNIQVETNIFTVKGSFKNLLGMEYAIENNFRIIAKIMSARFFSIRDVQTKHKNLYLTLIIQSFNQKPRPKNKT